MTAAPPTELDGMTATATKDFDHEQWTTCHIGRLKRGTVFSLPSPFRPMVLTRLTHEPIPGQAADRVAGTAIDLATGEATNFELLSTRSVLTRCDLHYT